MMYYIKGLKYADAEKAVKLINEHAAQQAKNKDISELIRSYWKAVYANISTQSVAVHVDNILQVHELNVILVENDLEVMSEKLPFLFRSPDEKKLTVDGIMSNHLNNIVEQIKKNKE